MHRQEPSHPHKFLESEFMFTGCLEVSGRILIYGMSGGENLFKWGGRVWTEQQHKKGLTPKLM